MDKQVVIFESGSAKWVFHNKNSDLPGFTSNREQAFVFLDENFAKEYIDQYHKHIGFSTITIHSAAIYSPHSI